MITADSVVTIIIAIFASTGFWSFISSRFQSKDKKKDDIDAQIKLQSKMLKGLGHDRIVSLGEHYIKRKYITKDEYENLHDYLYIPYRNLDGNGTAEKVMKEVDKLPMREHEEGDAD